MKGDHRDLKDSHVFGKTLYKISEAVQTTEKHPKPRRVWVNCPDTGNIYIVVCLRNMVDTLNGAYPQNAADIAPLIRQLNRLANAIQDHDRTINKLDLLARYQEKHTEVFQHLQNVQPVRTYAVLVSWQDCVAAYYAQFPRKRK